LADRESDFEAVKRLVMELDDARGRLYLFLLEAGRPVSRSKIRSLLSLPEYTVERALKFLYDRSLVDKVHDITSSGKEAFYFVIPQ